MHKGFCALIFIFFSATLVAQITIDGQVTDSLKKPLPFANVIAKPIDTTQAISYAITDANGFYKLLIKKEVSYSLTVSYLGYFPFIEKMNLTNNINKLIVLKEATNSLKEVIIDMPVTVRGDTTRYKVSSFLKGDELKLKDVLKNLPGIEVDDKGTVTFQGKIINTLMVEGKQFFDGKTKLAIENIPANVLDKIDVLSNYNEVPFLKQFSQQEQTAINIRLKEDKKNFIFGNIEVGKGNNYFNKALLNLFYFSPKTQSKFIGNKNNIGEQAINFGDYLLLSGAINPVFTSQNTIARQQLLPVFNIESVEKSSSDFAALNINQDLTSTTLLSGYVMYSKFKNDNLKTRLIQFPDYTEVSKEQNEDENKFVLSQFTLQFNPTYNFKGQLKTTVNSISNAINSELQNDISKYQTSNFIRKNHFEDQQVFNQLVELHYNKSLRHTFSFLSNFTYQKGNPNSTWNSNQPFLKQILPLQNDLNYRVNQFIENKARDWSNELKYFWILNSKNHLYTTVGNLNTNETFVSLEQQQLSDGSIKTFGVSDYFGNNTVLKFNDFFLKFEHLYKSGITSLTYGFSFKNYRWSIDQLQSTSHSKWFVLPEVKLDFKLKSTQKLQLSYYLNTSFYSATTFAENYSISSFNAVKRGDSNLENELFHNIKLHFNKTNFYKGIMMYLSLNYRIKAKGLQTKVDFKDGNQILSEILLNNANETLQFSAYLNKGFSNFKLNFKGNFTQSTTKQSINNSVQNNKSKNLFIDVGLKNTHDKLPIVWVGVKYNTGHFNFLNTQTNYQSIEPYVNFDYQIFEKMTIHIDYAKFFYKNNFTNRGRESQMFNASLRYQQEKSPWYFTLTLKNINKNPYLISYSSTPYQFSETTTYVMPSVALFSVGYNF